MGIIRDAAITLDTVIQFVKERIEGTVDDIHAVGLGLTAENAQSLLTYATQMQDGRGVQDADMRQEKLIAWLFTIPHTSKSGVPRALEHLIISSLWNALPHPGAAWEKLSGPQYRRADGSYNNPSVPNVGKAGGRYIRDVTPSIGTMKAQKLLHNGKGLPRPEDVFEKLYRRRRPGEDGSAGFKKHPCGISSNMFYWATLVTHDLFNTDNDDRFINKTTSYVDMGWLYGAYHCHFNRNENNY
jgi:linoleate 10R-lipoxygenase